MKDKTLIIGASVKPDRYSYKAAEKLLANGHDIYMLGHKEGVLFDLPIIKEQKLYEDVDTVTMYVGPRNQEGYYDYIVSLQPRRVLFNPGTENPDFELILDKHGIEHEQACTLVLLATKNF